MKRTTGIIGLMLLTITLYGCGDSTASRTSSSQTPSVNDVLNEQMAEADAQQSSDDVISDAVSKEASADDAARQSGLNENAPAPEDNSGSEALNLMSSTEGVDVDLTVLSSTMVYSEVYNMMVNPNSYVGKTVRMRGSYSGFYDETSDNYYFACIIQDATACCSQGIEFVLTDDYTYPDDYPEDGDIITVTGVFDTYLEGEYMYCTLRNATLM